MAKENPAQPIFTLARAVLEECDRQADRWLEYGIAQAGEAAKIARTMRAQAMAASKSMIETVENIARSVA